MEKPEQARCWPNWNRCGRRCTRATWPTHHPQGSLSLVSVHRLDNTWVRPRAFPKIGPIEFYEEWLNAMRLEVDRHIEIGTFSADVVPKGINVITAKWVFAWKTDSDGYITKAKARLVARGFGQQLGVYYFNTFAPTPTVSSIKVALAIAVQNDWPLYHFDVKQAFVQAKLDTDVYMKLPYGCGERTGKVVKARPRTLRDKAGRTSVVGCSLSDIIRRTWYEAVPG